MRYRSIAFLVSLSILTICTGGVAMALEMKSSAFTNGGAIPVKYSYDDSNYSPPLSWSDVPTGTKTFALISDDPDAPVGTWVHWVMWNIPANTTALKEGLSKEQNLSGGIVQGMNDFRKNGYDGPSPPSGTHRYFFKLYALDSLIDLAPSARKADLVSAMKGHVLAETSLIGTYTRK
jgi:Raf kinase inhibitor-like YbhB/YbcL family protein